MGGAVFGLLFVPPAHGRRGLVQLTQGDIMRCEQRVKERMGRPLWSGADILRMRN